MSNAGQIALGVVGAVAGFYVGGFAGAAYGFQLGLAVGTVVSPTQLPGTYGPRLTDNRTTSSQIGAPVVQVFGTDAVAGTVMWLGDIIETANTTEVGGKGSPEGSQTTFSYTQPIAIGLAAGPMGGILRIWENGKLVYDRREQQPTEDEIAFGNRLTASDIYELTFTLYLGDEAQLPDPTIELKEGVGNVPGFRGLMYMVYTARELRDDQARRHPNFKFEVFDSGSQACVDTTEYSNELMFDWTLALSDPRNPCNDHSYEWTGAGGTGPQSTLAAALAEAESGASLDLRADILAWGSSSNVTYPVGPYQSPSPALSADPGALYGWLNVREPASKSGDVFDDTMGDEYSACDFILSLGGDVWWSSENVSNSFSDPGHGIFFVDSSDATPADDATRVFFCRPGGETAIYYVRDWAVAIRRVPVAPIAPCDGGLCVSGYTPSTYPGYCYDQLGRLVENTPWSFDDSRAWHVLQTFGDGDPVARPLNPALPDDHPDYNDEAFWTVAYDAAVVDGKLPDGWTFGVDYPQAQGFGYVREFQRCTVSTQGVSIADIVRRICIKCGLLTADIDVSDLVSRYVAGYQIGRVMDGRSAIGPLRSVGFFDAVESGGVIKFPVRGKASVRTLEESDIGAHDFNSDAPALVTTRKQQDVELPRQLFVQYRDPERDYETGEQGSPARLTTDAVNDSYVDVAVAISAQTAAKCAEVLWADAWAARWQHSIATDCAQIEIEPADCFLIPVDGRYERVRAVSVEDSAVIMRTFTLVRDDDGSYVSQAVADPSAVLPNAIIIYSPTLLMLLDLPPLRATDNDVGVYAAMRPAAPSQQWRGAQIFRSLDGSTFESVGAASNIATTGTLVTPFVAGETTVWDEVTVISLNLISGGLESRPDADVLAGANTIAIGANGRWEVLQFANAVQTGPTTYDVSRLLRGRRGTEHNMGTQESGDSWVLVSGPGIIRLALTNTYLNQPLQYKAVTLGTSYGSGVDQTFTSNGAARLAFSPVSIAGARDTSDDLLISWIRRDRLGDELPDGSAIAMSDPPESYEIDILSEDSPPTVVRTLTSNIESVAYTAAQQVTDFGMLPADVTVLIYQISTVVGRGTPGMATI